MPRDLRDIAIESTTNEVVIAEDERLLEVESDGDDIPCVFLRKFVRLLYLEFVLEQKLLVVRQLHDQRDIEDVL